MIDSQQSMCRAERREDNLPGFIISTSDCTGFPSGLDRITFYEALFQIDQTSFLTWSSQATGISWTTMTSNCAHFTRANLIPDTCGMQRSKNRAEIQRATLKSKSLSSQKSLTQQRYFYRAIFKAGSSPSTIRPLANTLNLWTIAASFQSHIPRARGKGKKRFCV